MSNESADSIMTAAVHPMISMRIFKSDLPLRLASGHGRNIRAPVPCGIEFGPLVAQRSALSWVSAASLPIVKGRGRSAELRPRAPALLRFCARPDPLRDPRCGDSTSSSHA